MKSNAELVEQLYRIYTKATGWINLTAFQAKVDAKHNEVFKREFPRRKKIDYSKISQDGKDEINQYALSLREQVIRIRNKRKILADTVLNRMLQLPVELKLLAELTVVQECSTHVYHSQPNAHGYAKASLVPVQQALEWAGYTTEIRYEKESSGKRFYGGDYWEIGTYSLYANCTKAQAWQVWFHAPVDVPEVYRKAGLDWRVIDPYHKD